MPGCSRNWRRTSWMMVPGGRTDRADRERAEEEDQHQAQEATDEDLDLGQIDREGVDAGGFFDLVEIGREQQEGGQRRRSDGVALGQRLRRVADPVQDVGDVPNLFGRLGELCDATGVVGDRPEGVHRQDVGHRGQHAHGRDRGAEQTWIDVARGQGRGQRRGLGAKEIRQTQGDRDDDRRDAGALEADGKARDDVGRGARQRGASKLLHRPPVAGGVVLGDVHEGDARQQAGQPGQREPVVAVEHDPHGADDADGRDDRHRPIALVQLALRVSDFANRNRQDAKP